MKRATFLGLAIIVGAVLGPPALWAGERAAPKRGRAERYNRFESGLWAAGLSRNSVELLGSLAEAAIFNKSGRDQIHDRGVVWQNHAGGWARITLRPSPLHEAARSLFDKVILSTTPPPNTGRKRVKRTFVPIVLSDGARGVELVHSRTIEGRKSTNHRYTLSLGDASIEVEKAPKLQDRESWRRLYRELRLRKGQADDQALRGAVEALGLVPRK